jgi:hypothetical protein
MQADRVLHRGRLAEIVGHRHVKIMDVADAIAAELQRIGEFAEAIFAGIERTLPEMIGGRIGIGHDHVGDTGAIDDRALLCAVAKRDLVQHEALARGPADTEREILPAHLPAVDREARAFLLHDIERLDVLAHLPDRGAIVVARLLRDRNDLLLVDQLHDPVLDQVDQRDHALDRMRVAVVLGVAAPIGDGADQPPALLDLAIEIAGGERIDLDQFDLVVIKAATRHGVPPAAVALDDVTDLEHLLDRDRRLAVGVDFGEMLPPGHHLVRRKVHDRDMGRAGPAIEQGRGRPSRRRCTRTPAEHVLLGRLLELDMGEADVRPQSFLRPQDVGGKHHLGLAEGIEGMGGDGLRKLRCWCHGRAGIWRFGTG